MPRKKAEEPKVESKRPTRSRAKKQDEPPQPAPSKSSRGTKTKKTFEKDEKAPRSVTSSPRVKKMKPTPSFSVTEMRQIFTASQNAVNINKCIDRLNKIFEKSDNEEDVHKELKRNIRFALQGEEKSPYTKHCLEFISKFVSKQWRKDVNASKSDDVDMSTIDDITLETFGYGALGNGREHSLSDLVLKDPLIPCLSSASATVRFNTCYLIRIMFADIEDIEDNVFDALKSALVARMADKNTAVRCGCARALYRFQDTSADDDVATHAYLYHLKNDPDAEVRQSILYAIELSQETLAAVILRTRDVKDSVRKVAYHKLAERVKIDFYTIEQRLGLLKEGLRDRNPAVRKTVEKELVASWLKHCNHDIVKMLTLLDIQSDIETVDMLMKYILNMLLDSKSDNGLTKLHAYVDDFRKRYLDARMLLKNEPLSVENSYLWRTLAAFCKENSEKLRIDDFLFCDDEEDQEMREIKDMLDQVQIPDLDTEPAEDLDATLVDESPTPPKQRKVEPPADPITQVLPQLPHLCDYVKRFVQRLVEMEPEDPLQYEFMYKQLTGILFLVDVGEEGQKKALVSTIKDVMFIDNVDTRLQNVSEPLMKILGKNAFRDSVELLKFTENLTQEVFNKDSVEEVIPDANKPDPHDPAYILALDNEHAKLTIQLEEINDKIGECVRLQKFADAEVFLIQKHDVEKRLKHVQNERLGTDETDSIVEEIASQNDRTPVLSEPAMLKCLQIFTGCLEFGQFTTIDTFIKSHLEHFSFAAMLVDDPRIRNLAVKSIGICAFMDLEFAKKYLALFLQVLTNDVPLVRVTAFKCFFDFLCEHGIDSFVREEDQERDQNKQVNVEIGEEAGVEVSDVEDEQEKSQEGNEVMTLDSFIDLLTDMFVRYFSTESIEMAHVAVEGVAKLLQLGKIYSPQLLSKLVLIWYNEHTPQSIKHFLGVFLPFFAFSDKKRASASSGQSTFEEAYIPTIIGAFISSATDEGREEDAILNLTEPVLSVPELENLIAYMTTMLDEETSVRVSYAILNEMIKRGENRMEIDHLSEELISRYFPKALSILDLYKATKSQLKQMNDKLDKAIDIMESIPAPVLMIKRVNKVKEKVVFYLERLQEEDDNSQLSAAEQSTIIEAKQKDRGEKRASSESDHERIKMPKTTVEQVLDDTVMTMNEQNTSSEKENVDTVSADQEVSGDDGADGDATIIHTRATEELLNSSNENLEASSEGNINYSVLNESTMNITPRQSQLNSSLRNNQVESEAMSEDDDSNPF